MAKYCISCGAFNRDGTEYCVSCRARLQQGMMSTFPKSPISAAPMKPSIKKSNKGVWAAFILIVLILVAGGAIFYSKGMYIKAPTKEEVTQLLTGRNEQYIAALESSYDENNTNRSIQITEPEISSEGENATVTYTISANYTYADCTVTIAYPLEYVNREWIYVNKNLSITEDWNYHDIEGVWEEKDNSYSWMTPRAISIEKSGDGYIATVIGGDWFTETLGATVEITKDKMCNINGTVFCNPGEVRLFLKGAFETYFILNPDCGITYMKKIQ